MHQAIMPYKKSCGNRLVDPRGSHVFLLKSSWYVIDVDLRQDRIGSEWKNWLNIARSVSLDCALYKSASNRASCNAERIFP